MATLKPVPFPDQYGMFKVEEDFRDAAYRGDRNRLKDILDKYPDFNINATNEYNETALYIACKKNQESIVDFLLSLSKINLNQQTILGNSPVLICAWNKNTELAKKLIEKGADVTLRTNSDRPYHGNVSALDIAEEQNNRELTNYLRKSVPSETSLPRPNNS